MDVIKSEKKMESITEVAEAHYTPDDIRNLISEDMKKKGYCTGAIMFSSDYAVVRDEWGMSCGTRTYFKEAIVEILEDH